jgi:hypothetical protein
MRTRLFAVVATLLAAVPALSAQSNNGAVPVRFFDLAPQAGVDVECFGRGSAIVDLDGDGLLDLVATSSSVQTYYFRQLPGAASGVPQFREMTAAWRIPQDTKQSWGTVAADFDNDGDQDLYFPCGAFHYAEANRLLRNDLNTLGVFTRMGPAEGGDAVTLLDSSFGASAVDYDRDGDLDIFTAATFTFGSTQGQPVRLLRNDGGLHFTDVGAAAGLTHLGNYKHTGVGDIDNDGWPDLGVGQIGGPARLYRNNRDGTFREIAQQAGLADPFKNFGFVFDDFDNDGWQDVFLPQYLHVCCTGISRLFLNNRDGTFRDVSQASNIGRHEDMGHNVGDLNADGFPDIYIGAGHPTTVSFDVLYLTRPNGGNGLRVLDQSVYSRLRSAGLGRNHGAPFGDVNDDGFVDIWAVNGGPATQPNTIQKAYLWLSEGNHNRWLKADLRGVISNRDAVGARLSVRTQDGRDVHRMITAGRGFTNTDAHLTHFGLGQTARAAWLHVLWPSGYEQYHLDPPLGQTSPIVETVIWTDDVARLGQTVAIEATGPEGFEVQLMASRQSAFVLRPDLGGFLQLQGPRFELPPATLGPSGRLRLQLPVPADPSALGRTLYVQARVSQPVSGEGILTNRLDLVIQ